MSVKGSETVELRRVGRDRYGDPLPSESIATFTRCISIPRTLGEDNDRGSVAIRGHQVYIPPQKGDWSAATPVLEREIKDSDQLLVRGHWTDIEGHPARYVDAKGRDKGTLVTTRGEILA